MSSRSKENIRHQIAIPGDDNQKFEKIFHLRSTSKLLGYTVARKHQLKKCFFFYRFWMTKMLDGDSGPVIISQQHESSRSFAQCQCDWTKDGIKSNSICLILQDERMEQIMWKHCVFKFMQIAGYGESISPIDYILKTSYHQSLSCFYPFRNHHRKLSHKLKINQFIDIFRTIFDLFDFTARFLCSVSII